MTDVTTLIRALETRMLIRDATPAQVEEWWSLALQIGSVLDADEAVTARERELSQRLIWAVSGIVRAFRHTERPDHRDVDAALAQLTAAVTHQVWQ